MWYTAPQVDQLRALSLNRLDGMLRSTSIVADLPFKCTSDPRLGDRQLSSSTALDQLSLSPRLNSEANLSQDLDLSADLLPVSTDPLPVSRPTSRHPTYFRSSQPASGRRPAATSGLRPT